MSIATHRTLRRVLRATWAVFLRYSGVMWYVRRQILRQGCANVLMLHRVLNDESLGCTCSLPDIIVREVTFRHLLAYLAETFTVVPLQSARPDTKKSTVVITFDDGWLDNYTNAFPLLAAYDMPWTLFICSGLTGKNAPFWPERAIAALRASAVPSDEIRSTVERLKLLAPNERDHAIAQFSAQPSDTIENPVDATMSWEQVRELDRAGVCIGAHTHSHQILTSVTVETASMEVSECRQTIEKNLGKPCKTLAYPNGNCSPAIRHLVSNAGFGLAVTTQRGLWHTEADPLTVPRNNICEDNITGLTGSFSPAMFEYTTIWKAWRASRTSRLAECTTAQTPPVAQSQLL